MALDWESLFFHSSLLGEQKPTQEAVGEELLAIETEDRNGKTKWDFITEKGEEQIKGLIFQ